MGPSNAITDSWRVATGTVTHADKRVTTTGTNLGLRVNLAVTLSPRPRHLYPAARINGVPVASHMEGSVCLFNEPVFYGDNWSVGYYPEDWEARARRTWA